MSDMNSPKTAGESTFNSFQRRTTVTFAHQSQGIDFGEWISLFTLCLAPLIVHIIAGVPSPIYLHSRRPKWHERIVHYNPTSILWRYFAIFDRRVRSKVWNSADMAASNAHFWMEQGWDGSEQMMEKSRAFCTRLPDKPRISFLSETTAKTLIVTLQGVQAVYVLIKGAVFQELNIALDQLFFPLAILGLLRLFAALWLSDDFSYANQDTLEDSDLQPSMEMTSEAQSVPKMVQPHLVVNLLQTSGERLYLPSSWRGVVVRILYILPLLGYASASTFFMTQDWEYTTTGFLVAIFFFFFTTTSLFTFAILFILGRSSTTTIIPCITSRWYKVYSCFLFMFAIVVIIVGALETRKTPCGKYTTWPSYQGNDAYLCSEGFLISPWVGNGNFWAIANWIWLNSTNSEVTLQAFSGWCQGVFRDNSVAVVPANSSLHWIW
jgi:hypothetical protein